jgi:protein-tyrosine phosphatase
MKIVTLCTGNVARSVMLGYMLETLAESQGWSWEIRTAGTFAIENQGMSSRTFQSLTQLEELGEYEFAKHRSRQITDEDVRWADVVFASEADHVHFVRSNHPHGADKVVQLKHFVATAPLDGPLGERVGTVSELAPDVIWDVIDPAGGDQATYDATAQELWDLTQALGVLLAEEYDSSF